MKIFVAGTRGIPDISGGVEKHCQELYPLIAARGHEVFIATRKSYVECPGIREWKRVRLVHLYAPRQKSLEAIVHTFLAVLKAWQIKPDVLHIHAVGPGLLVPLGRILGMKVVMTHHGPDYERQKWGRMAKLALRLGEWLGGRFANEVIVISRIIETIVRKKCRRSSHLIYNGVRIPDKTSKTDYLETIGVLPQNYILAVGRFVPEKGLDLLVKAFREISGDLKLVIAGDADHETTYSRNLKREMAKDRRIVGTGYITGEPLHQLYSHAGLFVLPSFHEGLPIALLEAMSYALPVLVSDIPANLEVELPKERFFRCGDPSDLKKKIRLLWGKPLQADEKELFEKLLLQKYNWETIADQTIQVYEKVLSRAWKAEQKPPGPAIT